MADKELLHKIIAMQDRISCPTITTASTCEVTSLCEVWRRLA